MRVRSVIFHRTECQSSESGFPATQSNRTHSQITQLVESHDWGEHAFSLHSKWGGVELQNRSSTIIAFRRGPTGTLALDVSQT